MINFWSNFQSLNAISIAVNKSWTDRLHFRYSSIDNFININFRLWFFQIEICIPYNIQQGWVAAILTNTYWNNIATTTANIFIYLAPYIQIYNSWLSLYRFTSFNTRIDEPKPITTQTYVHHALIVQVVVRKFISVCLSLGFSIFHFCW